MMKMKWVISVLQSVDESFSLPRINQGFHGRSTIYSGRGESRQSNWPQNGRSTKVDGPQRMKLDGPPQCLGVQKRMKVDGPQKMKVDCPKMRGRSRRDESGRSRVKVDGLLTESGRSFDEKWTVLKNVDRPSKSVRSRGRVDGPKGRSGRFKW